KREDGTPKSAGGKYLLDTLSNAGSFNPAQKDLGDYEFNLVASRTDPCQAFTLSEQVSTRKKREDGTPFSGDGTSADSATVEAQAGVVSTAATAKSRGGTDTEGAKQNRQDSESAPLPATPPANGKMLASSTKNASTDAAASANTVSPTSTVPTSTDSSRERADSMSNKGKNGKQQFRSADPGPEDLRPSTPPEKKVPADTPPGESGRTGTTSSTTASPEEQRTPDARETGKEQQAGRKSGGHGDSKPSFLDALTKSASPTSSLKKKRAGVGGNPKPSPRARASPRPNHGSSRGPQLLTSSVEKVLARSPAHLASSQEAPVLMPPPLSSTKHFPELSLSQSSLKLESLSPGSSGGSGSGLNRSMRSSGGSENAKSGTGHASAAATGTNDAVQRASPTASGRPVTSTPEGPARRSGGNNKLSATVASGRGKPGGLTSSQEEARRGVKLAPGTTKNGDANASLNNNKSSSSSKKQLVSPALSQSRSGVSRSGKPTSSVADSCDGLSLDAMPHGNVAEQGKIGGPAPTRADGFRRRKNQPNDAAKSGAHS
ncbi:unnamed protein product, partial [Amoebophrya sp. A25]